MEKYGIIACPSCRYAKIVDLSIKSTKCIKCNKILVLNKVKILSKSNSIEELRNALGLVNAKLDGNIDEFKKYLNNKKIFK